VLASTLLLLASVKKPAQADFTFNFTAIGDYAETNYTNANLSYIAHQSGASFNLGLGDFDYTHTAAAQWSSYVTNSLQGVPFENAGLSDYCFIQPTNCKFCGTSGSFSDSFTIA
jgi:hypothetical protein